MHNMPQTAPGSLTAQEAFDLSAFINAQPRPDSPGKEDDWPMGGAPADVPYDTKGHEAAFVRDELVRAGLAVELVDSGCLGPPQVEPAVIRSLPDRL